MLNKRFAFRLRANANTVGTIGGGTSAGARIDQQRTRRRWARVGAGAVLIAVTAAVPFLAASSALAATTPTAVTAYVTNSISGTVTPVNLATNTPGTPITVGAVPFGIAITPDGTTAYVTNSDSDTVTPINLATNTPGTPITVGAEPHGIAITPDGTTAYVTNSGTNSGSDAVTPINLATNTPGTPITVGAGPQEIAITPDGTTAYVTNSGSGTVTPINLATNTPGTPITVGEAPYEIAITPDGTTAYVGNSDSGTVTPITVATNSPGTPITAGAYPIGIAITPDGTTAYVTNYDSDTMTPINLATNTPGTPITVGVKPWSIAITPSASVSTATPTITNLSVRYGPIAGGTPVVVTGSGFGSPGDADTVTFVPQGGGTPIPAVDVSVKSDTEIDVNTPNVALSITPGSALHTNVQVTNADGNISAIGPSGEFNFPATVVEMGDSIAAGEGTMDGFSYSPATPNGLWSGGVANVPGLGLYPDCHDSLSAYGQVLSNALDVNFVNLACTGASFSNGIIGPEAGTGAPAQFPSAAFDAAQPDAVVMTYGADDVQFSDIIKACMASSVANSSWGRFLLGILPGPLQCVNGNPGNTVETDFFDELPKLTGSYADLVSAIESQGAAASPARVPKIIFTDYMDPFPPSGTCNDTWPLTQAQVSYLNTLVAALNSTIEAAVLELDDPNVSFVQISGALVGHTWCTSDPWDYGLSISTGGGLISNILSASPTSDAPFHPTPAGQAALAKLVQPEVAAALGMNGTGAAVTSASDDGGGSADGVTAEPGDTLATQASGFAPDETVDATLHSTAVSLGSVTADADGNINATVTIPLGTSTGPHELLFTGQTSGLTATLPVLIPAPSAAPVFTTDSPPLTMLSGGAYAGYFGASGVPSPTYALAPGAPSWLSLEPAFTGIVSGIPPPGTTSFSYSVVASNGVSPDVTAGPFTVSVTSDTLTGNIQVTSGQTLTCPTGEQIVGNVTVKSGGTFNATGCTISGNVNSSGTVSLSETTVSGNVQTSAGPLTLASETAVGGNVQLKGSGPVSITGSTIGGNLQVQNTTSSATSSICGTTIRGNLQWLSNASPVFIGGSSTCPSNTIDGNLQVQSNSGQLTIGASGSGNTVTGNIQVQGNTGGGTLAYNTTAKGKCQLQSDTPGIAGSNNSPATCNITG